MGIALHGAYERTGSGTKSEQMYSIAILQLWLRQCNNILLVHATHSRSDPVVNHEVLTLMIMIETNKQNKASLIIKSPFKALFHLVPKWLTECSNQLAPKRLGSLIR